MKCLPMTIGTGPGWVPVPRRILGPCIFPYYPPTTKVDDLIGSELTSLNTTYSTTGTASSNDIVQISDANVLVEVIAIEGQYQTLLNLLRTPEYGLTAEVDNGPNTLLITGLIPILNLPKLNELPLLINYVRPVYAALGNSGLINSKGDISMRSNLARSGFNVAGAGVKVGVLSDSYDTQPGNQALIDIGNGDLPGSGNEENPNPVQVLKDYPYGTRLDEGRAMLQIVHDIAPKADLAFRTGFISAGDFAQGIIGLQEAGCSVIVDDITYITEPFFQDGKVAQAVDYVTSLGVSYFTSAGNYGSKSYHSTFQAATAPTGITGSAHDFGGGDIFQGITLGPGTYTVVLQWEDPIYSIGQTQTGTLNDLDIYLTNNNGTTLFGFTGTISVATPSK